MCEMTTVWETKTHETILWLNQSRKCSEAVEYVKTRGDRGESYTYLAV